jgi:excisionase family DNA binding protein
MNNSHSDRSSRLLSIAEVAWLLGIDTSKVCRAIRQGRLPVVRRGRRLMVPAHALAHLTDNDDAGADQAELGGRGDAR